MRYFIIMALLLISCGIQLDNKNYEPIIGQVENNIVTFSRNGYEIKAPISVTQNWLFENSLIQIYIVGGLFDRVMGYHIPLSFKYRTIAEHEHHHIDIGIDHSYHENESGHAYYDGKDVNVYITEEVYYHNGNKQVVPPLRCLVSGMADMAIANDESLQTNPLFIMAVEQAIGAIQVAWRVDINNHPVD